MKKINILYLLTLSLNALWIILSFIAVFLTIIYTTKTNNFVNNLIQIRGTTIGYNALELSKNRYYLNLEIEYSLSDTIKLLNNHSNIEPKYTEYCTFHSDLNRKRLIHVAEFDYPINATNTYYLNENNNELFSKDKNSHLLSRCSDGEPYAYFVALFIVCYVFCGLIFVFSLFFNMFVCNLYCSGVLSKKSDNIENMVNTGEHNRIIMLDSSEK